MFSKLYQHLLHGCDNVFSIETQSYIILVAFTNFCRISPKKSIISSPSHHLAFHVAMGGTIWRFNQWLNFAWKWFNSIFDSKENCRKWFNSIFNSKENCQDSIQKKYSIRRKKPRIQFKKYSIQNYSWLIQFNNIFNSKLFLANSIQWNIQSKSWMSRGIAWWIDYIS